MAAASFFSSGSIPCQNEGSISYSSRSTSGLKDSPPCRKCEMRTHHSLNPTRKCGWRFTFLKEVIQCADSSSRKHANPISVSCQPSMTFLVNSGERRHSRELRKVRLSALATYKCKCTRTKGQPLQAKASSLQYVHEPATSASSSRQLQ
jgi:hypothetical protein